MKLKSRISVLPRKESRRFISLGFGVILSLSLIVSIFSYSQLTLLKTKIDVIADEYHVKTSLINQMHKIVSERSLAVHNIMNAGVYEPFRADDEFMHYNNLATSFIVTRQLYQDLDLSDEERILFSDALKIIRESQPLQDTLVSNALDGLLEQNSKVILEKDWQNEQRLYTKFNALLGIVNETKSEAHTNASEAYNQALSFLMALSIITIAIGLLVARYVVKRATISEMALFEEKNQTEITLQAIGDAIITTDVLGNILYVNPVAESIIGKNLAQLHGRKLASIIYILDENKEQIIFNVKNSLSTAKRSLSGATLYNKKTLKDYPIEGTTSIMEDERGKIIGAVNIFRDVSENKNLTELVQWQSTHDSLTGLINRAHFETLLSLKLAESENNKCEHAILYIDINQFTVINDTCGNIAGDMLLKRITSLILSRVRAGDIVSRMGGDEFGVLLNHCSIDQAQRITQEILRNIQSLNFKWEEKTYKISAGIGIELIDSNTINAEKVISNVVAACIIAKEKGRNSLWVHRAKDIEVAIRRSEMLLTAKITQALEEHSFQIYKQKILSVDDSGENNLYELLIRMTDDEGNQILPGVFIPAAERYSIMPDIDKWVISTVFSMLASKKAKFSDSEIICINLSGQSLSQKSFLEFVEYEVRSVRFDPSKICFEITETAAVDNLHNVTNFIEKLRMLGCKFALDDFGSGMSSFAYLRNFNVDYIKIDGSFVKNIVTDDIDKEMVKVMHNLGQVMNIKTIAEYVESDDILEELEIIGVNYVQGFSIHLPEPI